MAAQVCQEAIVEQRRTWLHSTSICLGLLLLASPVRAQVTASHDDCERQIRQLQARLDRMEAALETLLAERAAPVRMPPAPASEPRDKAEAVSVRREMPPELVPEIGKIGAQVGLLLSAASSPFRLRRGAFAGGFIDLPLFDKPDWIHGKISYEILVGTSESKTTFETTSNVAQVANLAALTALNPNGGIQNVVAAVTGTGPAPFPVTASTETRFRSLQVIPFAFKYTSTVFDRLRFRPYASLGYGVYVTIHNQNPAYGTPPNNGVRPDATLPPEILSVVGQLFGGKAPFGGPLVAGQISQSPELEARGLPVGHGNIDLGIQAGLGFEYRLSRSFSLGFDSRFNRIGGTNGAFKTYGTRLGFHF